eukprot:TRINITY_DN37341_c0_g1_i1.p1 TRINITY_DN37341_c0_g1~~TRINITY_DN37341_c0_g1_i1.p1  ORF type:complete len:257 (+),score=25.86 TRINITY_DN37341_c0_g1_i1:321-1091(+)
MMSSSTSAHGKGRGTRGRSTASTRGGAGRGKGRGAAASSAAGSSNTGDEAGEKKRTHGFTGRPSARLDKHKTANPFAAGRAGHKHKTAFGQAYSSGAIPCRINHGSIKSTLQWDQDPDTLPYQPLLLQVAEGLLETEHPYVFVAPMAWEHLLQAERALPKVVPLLPKLVPRVKMACASRDARICRVGLKALAQLAEYTGPNLIPHVGAALGPLNSKALDSKFTADVTETLNQIEYHCGPQVTTIIKSKVPTYQSVC